MFTTIIIFAKNTPGVLYRIADLFFRRKISIESLTMAETETAGLSRFTIRAKADQPTTEKIVKQLYRIIEVVKVFEAKDRELIFKEIALLKVFAKNPQRRREIEDLAELFKANIDFVGRDFLVLEKTGSEEEIQSLLSLFRPFGIQDFVRSGRIALTKEEEKLRGKFVQIVKKPSETALNLDISAIKKIEILSSKEKEVISLAQGVPNFQTPDYIKKAARAAMEKNLTDKYTLGYGIEPLRKALAEKVRRDNKIQAEPENIIVTHGAIEALMATFIALFDPGDELLVLSPDYASHITQIQIARHGGRPIFVPLKENETGWHLEREKIEAAITPQTKAILLCNPSNPIGRVYTLAELKEIAQIALKYNLFIITDEVYEYFIFDGREHISIGSFPEVAERTISIFSLSKTYAMTGWRLGYIVVEKRLAQAIFKIHESLITCPTAISQYAALAAIQGQQSVVSEFKKEYEKRRNLVVDMLAESKRLKLVKPEGAYYAFPQIVFNDKDKIDDYDLALKILKKAKVGVVPGSAFGPGGEGHIRISFGVEEEKLKEGLKRLINFVNKL
ncbi:MAG: acetolactate synthase small subunit [Patescibacteria group bacterium]|nr:acetolactate synthase small subunit [Patescibacteria group bacterium]